MINLYVYIKNNLKGVGHEDYREVEPFQGKLGTIEYEYNDEPKWSITFDPNDEPYVFFSDEIIKMSYLEYRIRDVLDDL